MRLKSLFLIAAALGLSAGIPPKRQDPGDLLTIPVNVKENHRLKLSAIASDVRKVTPEFNEESAFGKVKKLILYESGVIILDHSDNLLLFDYAGKFVRRIGSPWISRGIFTDGPNFTDITFDRTSAILYVSTHKNGILSFDLDGELIGGIEGLPPRLEGIKYHDYTLLGFSQTYGEKTGAKYRNRTKLYSYSFPDNKTDSVEVWTVFLDWSIASGTSISDYISLIDESTYVYYPSLYNESFVRDTLYRLQGNELLPALKLKFSNEGESTPSGGKSIDLMHICHADHFIFSDYKYRGDDYFFIYDVRTGSGQNMKHGVRDNIFH